MDIHVELSISHLKVGPLLRKVVYVGDRYLRVIDMWVIVKGMRTP